MDGAEEKLFIRAKEILRKNWRGKYTIPSWKLYPHQWSWDSAFISIGYSHYDQEKAQNELLSLFEGQWANGMLPHIVYREGEDYFPQAEYWETHHSPSAPDIDTSGITQPPVHALSALYVYENCNDKQEAKDFLRTLFPLILSFHRYLLTCRDPEDSGLATIFHPWESGLDNSLRWDEPMKRIHIKDLPPFKRIDREKVNSDQRPNDEDYSLYIYLVEIMKKNRYDEDAIYQEIPFKIKDIVFNSILYAANRAMLKIADIIDETTEEIESWIQKTKKNYLSFFCPQDPENRLVYDFDMVSQKRIEKRTVASLISLYTDLLSDELTINIAAWMKHSHICKENCIHKHPVITSISVDDVQFNPLNYWRGPVWINVNWLIYKGLRNYRLDGEAEDLRKSMIDLVKEHGFYEYFNPLTGDGLGANDFSWTAALLIDLISEDKEM